ncbi:MAG: transglycosylase SLT domain-containing protein [Thermoleophilaceae bacterium]
MRSERGQALLLMLGVLGVVLFGALVLAAWGQSLGAKGGRQRAADLAAVSAAAAMRDAFPRLFEPASSPGHMELWQYLSAARRAARDAGARNGAAVRGRDVTFPGPRGIAPMRVRVVVRDAPNVALGREVPVAAAATAAIEPSAAGGSFPGIASGGGYSGPLAYRQGKGMRPDVAVAFDRLAAAARAEAGLSLIVTSAFRSDAEQARLFAAHPDPRWVARPGESLHRLATELDLGPNAAYGWLAANAGRFGFVRRYSWEPWHFGYSRSPGSSSVGFGVKGGDGRATAAVQQFVPARYAPVIAKAAQRWSVSAHLLAAQLYAESGFNPFARSAAGAAGIAQFMPGTARSYGVANPFDPADSIDGQAHLMRDLLGRFASVPLALAAYNAGPGAVAACGCIPPYPETQAYVAKILGLLGGGADLTEGSTFSVRLVE